jgi:hypothetical protein
MAEVVPFPLTRRRAYIANQAHHALCMRPESGERHIQRQVLMQADVLRRKGVAEHLIERETQCMETAIRASLQRLLMGGVA